MPEPKFVGGFEAFMEKYPELGPQMFNLVKKCHSCGKPCAAIMPQCNNCLADISHVEPSKIPNVFMGFMYGIDKGAFPFKISTRIESADFLVFDDPLAITRCHVLSLPMNMYIPDIRHLFLNPAEGKRMLITLEEKAWEGIQFHLKDEEFKKQNFSAAARAMSPKELRGHVMKAFNLPPSQFQLHLQYMMPAMLPSHVGVFMKKLHFVKGRHFPLKYVLEALQVFIDQSITLPNAMDLSPEEFVKAIADKGIDYDAAHKEDLDKFAASNALLANFQQEDFEYASIDGKICNKDGSPAPEGAPDAKAVGDKDKVVLQNYGRPYTDAGKPAGVFYKYAVEPALLPTLTPAA